MIKHSPMRSLILSSVVALGIILAFALTFTFQAHAAPAIPPEQSNISQAPGGPAHFGPKVLTCTRQTGKTCITIGNTTAFAQAVSLNGKVVFTIPARMYQHISYMNAGTYVYSLADNAKLTVTVH